MSMRGLGLALGVALLGLAGCEERTYFVDVTLGADGSATILGGEPVPTQSDIPCVHDAHALDPTGSHAEWFAEEGMEVELEGWAKPGTGTIADRCWLMTKATFATFADWNTYIPFWTNHLANDLSHYADTHFFKAPTPGALRAEALAGGAVAISIGTEVFVGMKAKYGSVLLSGVLPGWKVDLRVTAPCPLATVSPARHATITGESVLFELDKFATFPEEFVLATTPGCDFNSPPPPAHPENP